MTFKLQPDPEYKITETNPPWTSSVSLRDYFAGQAMQSLISILKPAITAKNYPTQISEAAYKYADAMLKVKGEKWVKN